MQLEEELSSQILTAMEVAANKTATEYSRYGSDKFKQVYIYGGLDRNPTTLRVLWILLGIGWLAAYSFHRKNWNRKIWRVTKKSSG